MGRKASQQVTFSKGELDPDLSERVDLEHYWDSLAEALNCVFHPQGGVSDRGGFELCSDPAVLAAGTRRRLRRRIQPLTLTAGMVTAANGGTVANLVDQSTATLFTTNANTVPLFVVAEVDLGAAQHVDLVDVLDFSAQLAGVDGSLGVEFWNGTAWQLFADPTDTQPRKAIRPTTRRRRFGTSPGGPGGIRVLSRFWRLTVAGGGGVTGTISVGGLRFWQETAWLGPIDVREVAREQDESYELVITERNIDVFDESQRYRASIAVPISAQQIEEITQAGGFDTLLLFHEQIETLRLVRQGSAGEWNVGPAPYVNVPQIKPAVLAAGTQDEIQNVSLPGLVAGSLLTVFLGDLAAAPFVVTSIAALPAQIGTALGTLPGVDPAWVLSTLADAATPTVQVRFYGTNGLKSWPAISAISSTGVQSVTAVVQPGLNITGAMFGAVNGWPRCGAFVQERLLVGGFRAAPSTFGFSRPGSWDFTDTSSPLVADMAFFRTLDVDRLETISTCFVGRHLQLFTESGEWYIAAHTLDATQPQPAIRATAHGIRRAVPIVFADGGSLFVQEGGQTLRDMLWQDAQQSYTADPITVLSPQIMSDVVDVAHRSARSVSDGNLIFMANRDGSAGCLTLLRGQNVVAGAPWRTDGKWKAFLSNVRHQVFAVVERGGEHWLERWTPDLPLDFATTVDLSDTVTVTVQAEVVEGATIVHGAWHLEGRSDVWAYADGELIGPLTVTGGALNLGVEADKIVYGLEPPWNARPQVLRDKLARDVPFRPPARIYEVELALKATGALTIASNGGAAREVPLLRVGGVSPDAGPLATENGGAPGLPMLERLFTGSVRVGGLTGFSRHPYVTLSRPGPVPVHLKAMRLEAVMRD